MMKFKGAIFDFDGVVVDTTPLHYSAWEKLIVENYNRQFNFVIYENIVNGRRSNDVINELLSHLPIEERQKALQLKQQYYLEAINQGLLKVFPSTIDLIHALRANNIKIAVASSSRSVSYVLEQSNIIDLFDNIISGNDTKFGKPHPECFLKAATNLQLDAADCIVFEDARAGVEAAKAGGFLCVGIDRRGKPEHYMLADVYVRDLIEIDYAKLIRIRIRGQVATCNKL